MKILFTLLFLFSTISINGISQNLNYTYNFKIDSTFTAEESKDILTKIETEFITTKRKIVGYNTFQVESTVNLTEEQFRLLIDKMNYKLLSFSKTRGDIIYEEKTPPGGVNCSNASLVCSNTTISGVVTGYGVQELNSTNRGCLAGNEHQSSWYYLNVQTGGTLGMVIAPATTSDDYDFAIWGPFTSATAIANCPPTSAPIRCSFSSTSGNTGMVSSYNYSCWSWGCLCNITCTQSVTDLTEGAGGDKWVAPLTVTAGQVYIVLVDNYGASGNPYDLSFTGNAVLGCTPVILGAEVVDFSVINKDNTNLLTWKTLSEKDNDYFSVERMEGENWTKINQQNGEGTTDSERNYAFNDYNFRATTNYYRLKLTDYDGKSHYSNIITIDNSIDAKKILKITNFMGQEVEENFQGPRIIIYQDGSVIRRIGN